MRNHEKDRAISCKRAWFGNKPLQVKNTWKHWAKYCPVCSLYPFSEEWSGATHWQNTSLFLIITEQQSETKRMWCQTALVQKGWVEMFCELEIYLFILTNLHCDILDQISMQNMFFHIEFNWTTKITTCIFSELKIDRSAASSHLLRLLVHSWHKLGRENIKILYLFV